MISIGDSAEASFVVQASDTAGALALTSDDSFPEVFATSRMIALMEVAASRLMKPMLKEGELSVGVSLNVSHSAPTAVGATVKARATYLGPEGKLYKFEVEVEDEAGTVGAGEHIRAIVTIERLVAGAERRRSQRT